MKKIALFGALGLAALSLGACQTSLATLNSNIATTASNDLPALCTLAASAHASFATIAATGTLKASLIATEAQAWAGANSICAAPPSDVGTAMASLANAYAAIVAAKKSAGG